MSKRRCAPCGYFEDVHEFGTGKCPKETADKNGRRGTFRAAPEPERVLWREVIRRDVAARFETIEAARRPYVPQTFPPPQVPARPPEGPGEIAGYQGRQAVGLGRAAVAAGWLVAAYYARRHDGEEMCAVKMQRDDLRAVATWKRPPGKLGKGSGWQADVAYGWRLGTMPAKITHTDLERIVNEQ